jgi:8-oxo-dGTP pyrophosphatase MutT (NUDIX family)
MMSWILPDFSRQVKAGDYFDRRKKKRGIWGVRVIVPLEDGVVLVQHSLPDEPPFYVLPGGGIETGETIAEAGEREVKEETGLDVQVTTLMYVREFPGHPLEFYVRADYIGGELRLGSDPEYDRKQVLTDAALISFNRLLDPTFAMYPLTIRARLQADLQREWTLAEYLGAAE